MHGSVDKLSLVLALRIKLLSVSRISVMRHKVVSMHESGT